MAIARSLFRKGGDFTAAIVFEFATTNLIIEKAREQSNKGIPGLMEWHAHMDISGTFHAAMTAPAVSVDAGQLRF